MHTYSVIVWKSAVPDDAASVSLLDTFCRRPNPLILSGRFAASEHGMEILLSFILCLYSVSCIYFFPLVYLVFVFKCHVSTFSLSFLLIFFFYRKKTVYVCFLLCFFFPFTVILRVVRGNFLHFFFCYSYCNIFYFL